jgi:hypothetical protein
LALISAFLAAGIDNVSTLPFRDETFCGKTEIKSEFIKKNENHKISVNHTERDRNQATNKHDEG